MNMRRSDNGRVINLLANQRVMAADRKVLDEHSFQRMVTLERKRTERSLKPFLLILVTTGAYLPSSKSKKALESIARALSMSTRETDVTGWYNQYSVVGVMFTEFATSDESAIVPAMLARVT